MVYMTGYNVAITMFTGLGAVSYGYAFSAFATSIGQPGFYLDMHLDRQYTKIAMFESPLTINSNELLRLEYHWSRQFTFLSRMCDRCYRSGMDQ